MGPVLRNHLGDHLGFVQGSFRVRSGFNIVDTAKTLSHLAMAAMVDIEELIDIDDVYASRKEPRCSAIDSVLIIERDCRRQAEAPQPESSCNDRTWETEFRVH